MDRTRLLFFGHLANDSLYTSIPPILPILALHHKLPTAVLGLIPAAYMMTASFLQIGVGYIHDRRQLNVLMPVGLLMGGMTIALIGFADSYQLILLLAVLGGVGSALFHPVATSLSSVTGRRARSVSFFMTGGDLGLAAGSFICSTVVAFFGLQGTAFLLILPLTAAILTFSGFPNQQTSTKPSVGEQARPDKKAMAIAVAASLLRATTNISILTYLPLFLASKGVAVPYAGGILTLSILAGAAGMLTAGFFGEKIGKTKTVQTFFLLAAVLIPVAVYTSPDLALLTFPLIGFSLFASHPVLVAISHDLMPKHLGVASALMYGFTFGMANVVVPFLGLAVDLYNYETVFLSLTVFPVTAALLVSRIPVKAEERTIN